MEDKDYLWIYICMNLYCIYVYVKELQNQQGKKKVCTNKWHAKKCTINFDLFFSYFLSTSYLSMTSIVFPNLFSFISMLKQIYVYIFV